MDVKNENPGWFKPSEKTPERIKEPWFPEETAQEVIVQYVQSNYPVIGVGYYEDGKWWEDDVQNPYQIVAWRYKPAYYRAEIYWEFHQWLEKEHAQAELHGECEHGVKYSGITTVIDFDLNEFDKIYEIEFRNE